jgi:hypothetical protein
MAPLSNAVLATVKPAAALAVFFAIEANQSARLALLAVAALFALSIMACAAFLTWMRRVTG